MVAQSKKLQAREAMAPETRKARPKKGKPVRNTGVDTSLPGVSATDRKAGLRNGTPSTKERNVHRAGKPGASVALEDSATGTPSRKSTRSGSKEHIKPDSNLRRRQTRAVRSPKARQAKAAAQRTSPRGH